MNFNQTFADGGLVKIYNTSVTSDGKQNSFFQYYSIEGIRDYSVITYLHNLLNIFIMCYNDIRWMSP